MHRKRSTTVDPVRLDSPDPTPSRRPRSSELVKEIDCSRRSSCANEVPQRTQFVCQQESATLASARVRKCDDKGAEPPVAAETRRLNPHHRSQAHVIDSNRIYRGCLIQDKTSTVGILTTPVSKSIVIEPRRKPFGDGWGAVADSPVWCGLSRFGCTNAYFQCCAAVLVVVTLWGEPFAQDLGPSTQRALVGGYAAREDGRVPNERLGGTRSNAATFRSPGWSVSSKEN